MGKDHGVYVKNQLGNASKRSIELQAGQPDFSEAIDPFSDMAPMNEKMATSHAKHLVSSQSLNSRLYANHMLKSTRSRTWMEVLAEKMSNNPRYQNVSRDISIISLSLEVSWFQTITNFPLSPFLETMSKAMQSNG
jgi:hypothetical protein